MTDSFRRTARAALSGVFLGLFLGLLATPAAATMIHYLDLDQLSFMGLRPEAEISEFTGIGRLSLAYDVGPEAEFLNVLAVIPGVTPEPFWIVRNLVMHDDTTGAPYEEECTRFPLTELGAVSGVPVATIQFGYTQTPYPVFDEEYEFWSQGVVLDQTVPVGQRIAHVHDGYYADFSGSPVDPAPSWGDFSMHEETSWAEIWGCLFDNVDLDDSLTDTDWNGCSPAACASSLQWLRMMNPGQIPDLGATRTIYDMLSQLMNRNGPHPVPAEVIMRAKLDFIEAFNLPIEVKYQNAAPDSSLLPVSSTSGHSTAAAQDTGPYPTPQWLKQEVDNFEDVEMNLSYYAPGATTHAFGHSVVVTGVGKTGGQYWVKTKDDDDQEATDPQELRQVHSDIVINGQGQMVLPGLVAEEDSVIYEGRVTSVISESPKTGGVPGPPASENTNRWCQYIKRTVPPGGALELTFPDEGEGRCYNVTVWQLDREETPAEQVFDRQWNMNKGKTRRITNTNFHPVTYLVHNDEYKDPPYPSFDVDVNVTDDDGNPNQDDAGNQNLYGGYAVGGNDGVSDEFNHQLADPVVVAGPIQAGFTSADIPAFLKTSGGTHDLTMYLDIPFWNIYWDQTRFVIDVLQVISSGDLLVDCPSTGHMGTIPIVMPGRYEMDLGFMSGQPQFHLRLVAQNGLNIEIDGMGAPSLIPAQDTAVEDGGPPPRPTLAAWPNPFNPTVTFNFRLPAAGRAELAVFDLRGRRVATLFAGELDAEPHAATWNGRDAAGRAVPAGTYIGRLEADGTSVEERVTLVK